MHIFICMFCAFRYHLLPLVVIITFGRIRTFHLGEHLCHHPLAAFSTSKSPLEKTPFQEDAD